MDVEMILLGLVAGLSGFIGIQLVALSRSQSEEAEQRSRAEAAEAEIRHITQKNTVPFNTPSELDKRFCPHMWEYGTSEYEGRYCVVCGISESSGGLR